MIIKLYNNKKLKNQIKYYYTVSIKLVKVIYCGTTKESFNKNCIASFSHPIIEKGQPVTSARKPKIACKLY